MKSVLLIGLGRFGKHVAFTLEKLGHQVMAVDKVESRVDELLAHVTNALIGDSTNEDFLKSLGIGNYDLCIVCIGDDFQSSLETTSLLKELEGKLVVSRASSDVHAKFLLRNGADHIVYPEKQLAHWIGIRFSSDHIRDYIELPGDYSIFEVDFPDSWIGMTLEQLDLRRKYNINVLGFKRNDKLDMAVIPNKLLEKNETMLVFGSNDDIAKCFHI